MQLNVKTKKSEGTYGLIWGTRAFRLAEQRLDMEMNEIFLSVDKEEIMLALTYCAMQNWIQNEDESLDLPFTLTEFWNWLNDEPQETATKIAESYRASTLQGKSISDRYDEINEMYAEAEKKKNPGAAKVVKKKQSA